MKSHCQNMPSSGINIDYSNLKTKINVTKMFHKSKFQALVHHWNTYVEHISNINEGLSRDMHLIDLHDDIENTVMVFDISNVLKEQHEILEYRLKCLHMCIEEIINNSDKDKHAYYEMKNNRLCDKILEYAKRVKQILEYLCFYVRHTWNVFHDDINFITSYLSKILYMTDWDDNEKIVYYVTTATEIFNKQPDRFVFEYKKVQINFRTVLRYINKMEKISYRIINN